MANERGLLQLFVEQHVPGSATLYGLGHRRLGVADDRRRCSAGVVDGHHPDRCGDVDITAVRLRAVRDLDRAVRGVDHPAGDHRRIETDTAAADQQELVARDSADRVAEAEGGQQPTGYLDQHSIADVGSPRVVQRLEPIDVHEQHRQRRRFAIEPADRLFEPVHDQGTVREAGERIVESPVGHRRFERCAFDSDRDDLGQAVQEPDLVVGRQALGAGDHHQCPPLFTTRVDRGERPQRQRPACYQRRGDIGGKVGDGNPARCRRVADAHRHPQNPTDEIEVVAGGDDRFEPIVEVAHTDPASVGADELRLHRGGDLVAQRTEILAPHERVDHRGLIGDQPLHGRARQVANEE